MNHQKTKASLAFLLGSVLGTAAAWAACSAGSVCCNADSFCGEVICGPATGETCQCCARGQNTYACWQGACSTIPPGTPGNAPVNPKGDEPNG